MKWAILYAALITAGFAAARSQSNEQVNGRASSRADSGGVSVGCVDRDRVHEGRKPKIHAPRICCGIRGWEYGVSNLSKGKAVTTKLATNVLTVPELFALADQALSMERPVRGVDRYWLVAVALVESGGDPHIVGDSSHALGLHQFHMPAWKDCWGEDYLIHLRQNPNSSFRAAIRYAGKVRTDKAINGSLCRARISSHHHLGHLSSRDTGYINRVERSYKELVSEYGGK